ncbi:MAG TPA: urea carboxylase-associated family protein [Aquaticitalea sp.]|nr:urea carboxylase-associated family protein [Aquaticitalea sp.]
MISNTSLNTIPPQSGVAFEMTKGDCLTVIDPMGQQVSDMVLFNKRNLKEKLSSGKTFDFEETLLLTQDNFLWSNKSRKMMRILEDTNGRNDFLLAPCSKETFEIMYNHKGKHPSCLDNLHKNLKPYDIDQDDIPTAFNIFMNVQFDPKGNIKVLPPTTKPGDMIRMEALMDMVVGLTACAAEDSNGGTFKPINFMVANKAGVIRNLDATD